MDSRPVGSSTEDRGIALCGLFAFGVTWILSLWRCVPTTSWSSDYAAIQALADAPIGAEGLVSCVLWRVSLCVPIGSVIHRLSIVSATGAAFSCWFAFRLAHLTLGQERLGNLVRCSLALGAALLAHSSTVAQLAATRPDGAGVSAALTLGSIWIALRLTDALATNDRDPGPRELRLAALAGSSVAFAWLESHVAGVSCLLIGGGLLLVRRVRPVRAVRIALGAGLLLPVTLVGLPWYAARTDLAGASIEVDFLATMRSLRPHHDWVVRLRDWTRLFGLFWFLIALAGFILCLIRKDRVRFVWAPLTFVAAFLLLPRDGSRTICAGQLLGIVGGTALAAAATACVCVVLHWLTFRRPSARALAFSLAVVAQAVTVLARTDEAAFAADRYDEYGSDAWVDEAVATLPARSIVLVRSEMLIERLLAARFAGSVRPDVLVVPLERATTPRVVEALLAREPQIAGLLRDLAINGRPSENSLSGLADLRPVFIEFDPNWEPRLREHLLVGPYLHRVLSQTVGRSDRAGVLDEARQSVARLLGVIQPSKVAGPTTMEPYTRIVVDHRLREQMALLWSLGDRQAAELLARGYEAYFPGSNWMSTLRKRIEASPRGAIDALDLLREDALDACTAGCFARTDTKS